MNRLFVAIKEKKKSWRTTRKSWSSVKHARAFKKRHSAVSRYCCYFLKCKHQNVIWDSISKKNKKTKTNMRLSWVRSRPGLKMDDNAQHLFFFIYIYNKMIPMFSKRQKKKTKISGQVTRIRFPQNIVNHIRKTLRNHDEAHTMFPLLRFLPVFREPTGSSAPPESAALVSAADSSR